MGIGYLATAFGVLAGGPAYGALLGPVSHWSRPVIYSGVSALVDSFGYLFVDEVVGHDGCRIGDLGDF